MLLYDQLDSSNDRPVRPETRLAVKRALADAVLTLSARVVMGYLLMDHPQAVKRQQCPPLYVTAAALGLCTRTVQRAYDELEREGWLDDSRSGPDDLPEAAEAPERRALLRQMPGDLPARRAPPATLPPPTLAQHIEGYEVLRERALAANKLGIALRAHSELGRAMGFDRPKREKADQAIGAAVSLSPPSQMGEGWGGGLTPLQPSMLCSSPLPASPMLPHGGGVKKAPLLSTKAGQNWLPLAPNRLRQALRRPKLARIGTNWLT